ncbi:unnamed protein product, partial [Arctogadus glacialis]
GGAAGTRRASPSRRRTKVSVERDPSPAAATDPHPDPEPEKDAAKHSFIYSPSRRRTRNNRGGSPILSEAVLPVNRRQRHAALNPAQNKDEAVTTATVKKSRTAIKSSAKSKAALVPLAMAELISPLPSPAAAPPPAHRRPGEPAVAAAAAAAAAAAGVGVNQRRKRILEAVFTKPVTRRKRL